MNSRRIFRAIDHTAILAALILAVALRYGLELVVWFSSESEWVRYGYPAAASMIVGLHAILKLRKRHPLINLEYGRWLFMTPWRWPQPLPLGPVRISWQDAVVVAVFAWFCPQGLLFGLAMFSSILSLAYVGTISSLAGRFSERVFLVSQGLILGLALVATAAPTAASLLLLGGLLLALLIASHFSTARLLRWWSGSEDERLSRGQLRDIEQQFEAATTRLPSSMRTPYDELVKGVNGAGPEETRPRVWESSAWIGWFTVCLEAARWRCFSWASEVLPADATYRQVESEFRVFPVGLLFRCASGANAD